MALQATNRVTPWRVRPECDSLFLYEHSNPFLRRGRVLGVYGVAA
jgi:hypothetical protein